MFAVSAMFWIKPDMMKEFVPLMKKNAKASLKKEKDCHQFDVWQNEDVVFLYEVYSSVEAFDAHLTTTHFKTFNEAAKDMIADKQIRAFKQKH